MQNDLISRSALKKEMVEVEICTQPYSHFCSKKVVFSDDIDAAPTINAMEVVRCRECKHSIAGVISDDEKRMVRCTVFHDWIERDGYCHRGAKMDGGAEGV